MKKLTKKHAKAWAGLRNRVISTECKMLRWEPTTADAVAVLADLRGIVTDMESLLELEDLK